MRTRCAFLVTAVAIGMAALPSSASAAVVEQCGEGAGFSMGVPLPPGVVPPASPVGEPELNTGPSCSFQLQGFDCASFCRATVRASGTGLVAGRVSVFTPSGTSVNDCGPALNECEGSTDFRTDQGGFVRCSVSGVLAVFTAVSCEVRT